MSAPRRQAPPRGGKRPAPAARRKQPARKPPAGKPARPARQGPPVDPRIRARRRQVAQEQVRRRRRVTLSVLGLVLLLGGAYGVSRTPLFLVDEVRVAGVTGARAAQVREVAAIGRGTNLLDIDIDAVTTRVEDLPWVKEAVIRRLPTAVELRVTPRIAAAVVRVARAAWIVDPDGWLLAGGSPPELVRIDAPNAVLPSVGERIADRGVRNALRVHAALPDELREMVDRYEAPSDRGLRLRLRAPAGAETAAPGPADERGVWVRFGLAQRVEAKARVIGLLLDQAREQAVRAGVPVAEGELPPGIEELDVRAPDNPVLIPAGS